MKKRIDKIRKKKWKILLAAGIVVLFSVVGAAAFQEASVIYWAVSGKVAVHLEEYTVRDRWTGGDAGREYFQDSQDL